jgi:hypothetical protein
MHMQNPVLPEVVPQMLPHSHHALELPPIDHVRVSKPPLRPIHTHSLAAKRSEMPLSPSMNLISLRHRLSLKQKAMATALDPPELPSPPSQNQFRSEFLTRKP